MPERVYLVGGAVRDELLGIEPKERDWVVTGATPERLKRRGYRQVGASFPVFLHPETGEEYALARTERKQGHGYHGFTVDFHPEVTIEQDLERRDLTINAMARDADGSLIDPFGGQRDLEERWLRHVSPAFEEDPLRVLRVARFAARFERLGFRVHPDTLNLMRRIVRSGELAHLVPERMWTEWCKALGSECPRCYLDVLRDCGALGEILPEVEALFGVPQPPEHHPEVDTGEHLRLCLDACAALKCSGETAFAVLLHDLGKAQTPAGEWPKHRGHEQSGLPLVEEVCRRFKVPGAVRKLALAVCEHHLRAHRILEARPARVMDLLERLDAFRSDILDAFLQACEADYRGRQGLADRPYPQAQYLRQAFSAAAAIHARDLPGEPATGPEVGERLREARIAAIRGLTFEPRERPAHR